MAEDENALAQLLQKKLRGLKPTVTKVTKCDGSVEFYDHETIVKTGGSGTELGFVVDTKPDMSVAEVRPWLLISSQDVPTEVPLLQSLGVTHIISLLPGYTLPVDSSPLKHLSLDFYDDGSFTLDEDILAPAFAFIEDGRKTGGRVLVHCNAGISRAPSLVLAYLIKREKLCFESAWEAVTRVRPGAKPNSGFLNQLKLM